MKETLVTDVTLSPAHEPTKRGPRSLLAAASLFFVFGVLVILPGVIFSALRVTDYFLYQVIAFVGLNADSTHLVGSVKDGFSFQFVDFLPAYPMILSLISRLASYSPQVLLYFPAASFLLPLVYSALTWRLFRSRRLAVLFAIYAAYDIGLASHYNVFAYTWSNTMYLGLLLVLLNWLSGSRVSSGLTLVLLFAGSLFMHYAATVWIIVGLFALNLLLILRAPLSRAMPLNLPQIRASFALPGATIVAFLSFNQLLFQVWLPNFVYTSSEADPIQLLIAKVKSYLGQAATNVEPFEYLNRWGDLFGGWRLLSYAVLLLPVIFWGISIAAGTVRRRHLDIRLSGDHLVLTVVIFATTLVDWLVYGLYSGINMRYATLMWPFLAIIALRQFRFPATFKKAYAFTLVGAAIVGYILALDYYFTVPPTSYSETRSSTQWIAEHEVRDPILADLQSGGLFLSSLGSDDYYPQLFQYDSQLYRSVIDASELAPASQQYGYLLVDAAALHKPLHGVSNHHYEPLSEHQTELLNNSSLGKVYDDGSTWLFRNLRYFLRE